MDIWLGAIGIVVGLIALVLAIPPFAQMMWGTPRLSVSFEESNEPDGKLLLCQIDNPEVQSKMLRLMKVSRQAVDAFARFEIRRHGTNEILAANFRPTLQDIASSARALSLQVKAPLGSVFTVIEHTATGARAVNDGAPMGPEIVLLEPGEYYAIVEIAGAEHYLDARRSFTIHAIREGSSWTHRAVPPN